MGGCLNYGPLLGPLNTRWRITRRTSKGTIILTTAYMTFGQLPDRDATCRQSRLAERPVEDVDNWRRLVDGAWTLEALPFPKSPVLPVLVISN